MQIALTLKNYRCFTDAKPARIILRRGSTAFVGVNNAGKSSLLRFFFEFRPLFNLLSHSSGTVIAMLQGGRQAWGPPPLVADIEELFHNPNERDLGIRVQLTPKEAAPRDAVPFLAEVMLTVPRGTNEFLAHMPGIDAAKLKQSLDYQGTILRSAGQPLVDLGPFFEAFGLLRDTLYVGSFRNAVNIGATTGYYDIDIGQQFIRAWRAFKSGNLKKRNEAAYDLIDDVKQLFRYDSLDINPSEDEQTLQLFADRKSYRLAELGSGVAQIIIVLANVAIKRPAFILIDEPELSLHPGLQLEFMTLLEAYSRHGVLFATHNIGLARAAANWVFTVRRTAEGSEVTALESTARLWEFLSEMSFCGYRDLGFEKILLVEGPTEIKTVQQWLRQTKKDHRIVLLPLGGSSMINGSREAELEEMKRICADVSILIDSERSAAGHPLSRERQEFVDLCGRLHIACHVLERRATENYLPDRAVKKVKGQKYQAPGPYETLSALQLSWGNAENWRIAREMEPKELDNTDLGRFLAML